ncbi:MAG: acetyl-CoA hydrolase/transferase family protein [Pirellulaceae bacterium]
MDWQARSVSPSEVVSFVRSGMNVFLHGASATPTPLVDALAQRNDLRDVRIFHLHTAGPADFAAPGREDNFRSVSLFIGGPLRKAVVEGRADFIPIFLSDIPRLFASGEVKLDLALLQLSPPDRHGFCTLGTSVDAAHSAASHARIVLAEINEKFPRTHGNTVVPFTRVKAFTATNRALHEHPPSPETDVDARIGQLVAALVPDRACLQMGIGSIPDAVLARLKHKQDLGVHTEMFSDGLVELFETGAITNRFKSVHPGRIVTSFVTGTQKLFDFVHENPLVEFHPCDRTNDTALIRKNRHVLAINSAIQIDLTGQICADSFGHQMYSGIGGQMDFIRGAALSEGGKPILALPATAKNGQVSRIVPELTPGSGVVTTRGHVHWVATEYGAVNLHGKTLRQRAELLISIAHPDFRNELRQRVRDLRHYIL